VASQADEAWRRQRRRQPGNRHCASRQEAQLAAVLLRQPNQALANLAVRADVLAKLGDDLRA
jgi:hypothetical protein